MHYAECHGLPILTFDFEDFGAAPAEAGYWRLVVDEKRYQEAVRRGEEWVAHRSISSIPFQSGSGCLFDGSIPADHAFSVHPGMHDMPERNENLNSDRHDAIRGYRRLCKILGCDELGTQLAQLLLRDPTGLAAESSYVDGHTVVEDLVDQFSERREPDSLDPVDHSLLGKVGGLPEEEDLGLVTGFHRTVRGDERNRCPGRVV